MQFYDAYTHYNWARTINKGITDYRRFYAGTVAMFGDPDSLDRNTLAAECNWMVDHAPYYNIWPGIIPLLTSLKLDIDGGLVKFKRDNLMLRFPVGKSLKFEFNGQQHEVQTILASHCAARGEDGISMHLDIGERGGLNDPIYTIRNFQTIDGETLEEGIANLPLHHSAAFGIRVPEETMRDCMRIVCSIQLLDQGDSDLIMPQVLTKDLAKYERTKDPKYVEKARRRGKHGWDIGKGLTVKPHWRKPHLCLFWTGRGRTIPIIKQRGLNEPIIVHRKQVEQLPTDYLEGKDHAD